MSEASTALSEAEAGQREAAELRKKEALELCMSFTRMLREKKYFT